MKQRTTICREGWYYLLVFGFVVTGSIFREINLLLIVAGMMAFPFVLNWRAVVTGLRGVTIRRSMPSAVMVGEVAVVEMELRKSRMRWRSGAAWAVHVHDTVQQGLVSHDADQHPNLVPIESHRTLVGMCWRVVPGESARVGFRMQFHCRGPVHFGPTRLTTRFPLGMVQRAVEIGTFDRLIVYPQRGRLTRSGRHLQFRQCEASSVGRPEGGKLEGDFHGVRDWRSGDGQRRIHWRTTARRGTLVVRQFERHQDQDLALLLDLWQPTNPDAADEAAVERAIRFAATMVHDHGRQGDRHLVLGTTGREVQFTKGPASPSLLHEMLVQLALAEATDQDQRTTLLDGAPEPMRPGQTLLMVSTRPSVGTGEDANSVYGVEADAGGRTGGRGAVLLEVRATGNDGLSEYFVDIDED